MASPPSILASQVLHVDSSASSSAPRKADGPQAVKVHQTWTLKISTVQNFLDGPEIKHQSATFVLQDDRYLLHFLLRKHRDGNHCRTIRLECKVEDQEKKSRVFVELLVKAPSGILYLRGRNKDDRPIYCHTSPRLNHTYPFPVDLIHVPEIAWPGERIMFGCNIILVEQSEISPEAPTTNDVITYPSLSKEEREPNSMLDILENGLHSDFTINVKGREFKVHRAILRQNCELFARMLDHEDLKESRTGILELKDVDAEVFHLVLKFIYGNALKLEVSNESQILGLLVAADKYHLPMLKLQAEIWLTTLLRKEENFFGLVEHAHTYNAPLVSATCSRYFQEMKYEIINHAAWNEFKRVHPRLVIQLFEKEFVGRKRPAAESLLAATPPTQVINIH